MKPIALLWITLSLAACTHGQPSINPAVSTTTLDALVRYAGEQGSDVLVVWKDGEPLVEKWYRGEPRRLRAWSITKSVVALAILRLVDEGRIASLDQPMATWLPTWRGTPKEAITLRHVLTHSTALSESWDAFGGDYIEHAARAELQGTPGTQFAYSNVPINLLAGVVRTVTGMSLEAYVREELFEPLGIRDFGWKRDPRGNPDAMAGLEIAPSELIILGELMRRRGKWPDRHLDERLVDAALTPSATNPHLGLLWWLGPDGAFLAHGMHGQYLIVLPASGVTLVRMRANETQESQEIGNRLGELALELGPADDVQPLGGR